MNAKDIISLAAAGFTKDQIIMIRDQLEPKQSADNATMQTAMPIQPPAYIVQEPPMPTVPETEQPWDALIAELKGLRQEVINGNINHSQQPQLQTPSVDDILASIIAPLNKETGGNNT